MVKVEVPWLPEIASPSTPLMTKALPRPRRTSRLPTMFGLVEAWTSSSASVSVTSFTPSLRSFSA